MDILSPPPAMAPAPATLTTTTTTTVKTPDPETETPQSNTITKHHHYLPPPLTNGVLKRHKPLHLPPTPAPAVAYKECLKNHAATIGGHAVDGCGEFMPSPTSSPTYPTSLKCAACGCHRNFHRREPEESPHLNPPIQHIIEYQPHHRHHPPPPHTLPSPVAGANTTSPGNSPSPPPISSSYYPSAPHMLLALSTGISPPPTETHHPSIPTAGTGKKRFRTKFTQNQKEKMNEIAERVGWKMQKRDEEMIIGFCNEIGVGKGVFKVWMHNNKTKKDSGDGIDFIISRNNNHHHGGDDAGNNRHGGAGDNGQEYIHLHNNDSFSPGGNVICTKGSSSSS